MKSSFVILKRKSGNHSNRLIQNAHLEAWCIENGVNFINQDFGDMQYLYSGPFQRPSWIDRFKIRFTKKISISFDQETEKNDHALKELTSANSVVMADGFYFRATPLVLKYHEHFIQKYSLKQILINNNSFAQLVGFERTNKTLVGVHIRRGDYQFYKNGRYFYPDSIYLEWVEALRCVVSKSSNKPILFLLFSNEPIQLSETKDILLSSNEWYIDQHLMSQCDYLIGPPSTFTLWASYIGKVPLKHMYRSNANIELEHFQISNITSSLDLG